MKIFPLLLAIFCAVAFSACGLTQPPLPSPSPSQKSTVAPAPTQKTAIPAPETPAPTIEPTATPVPVPEVPSMLTQDEDGKYLIKVYDINTETVEELTVEEYLCGVVAAEMKNTWPEEALKAQAVLARTFLMAFLNERGHSMYSEEAHISTDIQESQAYDQSAVNDAVRDAVAATVGETLIYGGDFIKAWFHACSGGKTAYAVEGLAYPKEEPAYMQPVESDESMASESAMNWVAEFTEAELIKALKESDISIDTLDRFELGETGESGRAVTFLANGQSVSASDLRIALGSTKMRSTLIDELKYDGKKLFLRGRGYGHGVGMSQWGAYTMAKKGAKYDEIVLHYYPSCELYRLWE